MALMRFDPFRELDRFAEQVMAGSRVPPTMPLGAFRAQRQSPRQEGDELIVDERPQGIFTRQLLHR